MFIRHMVLLTFQATMPAPERCVMEVGLAHGAVRSVYRQRPV